MTTATDDLFDERAALEEVLAADETKRERDAARAPRGFDPACLFLLSLDYPNLFEPTVSPSQVRCKGCGDTVRLNERQKHHAAHKRSAARAREDAALAKRTTAAYPATASRQSVGSQTKEESEMATAEQKAPPKAEKAEPRVRKTKVARDAMIAVLRRANRPMKMDEIVEKALNDQKVKDADVPKGTLTAQLNFELAEKDPRVVRVERGTYAIKGAEKNAVPAAAAKAQTGEKSATGEAKPDPKPSTRKRNGGKNK